MVWHLPSGSAHTEVTEACQHYVKQRNTGSEDLCKMKDNFAEDTQFTY